MEFCVHFLIARVVQRIFFISDIYQRTSLNWKVQQN